MGGHEQPTSEAADGAAAGGEASGRQARYPGWALGGGAVLLVGVLLCLLYGHVGAYFVRRWANESAYHHCFLVLPLVGWLVWRQRQRVMAEPKAGSWAGLATLVLAALVYVAGRRTGANVIVGFSLPLVLVALGWAWFGWPAFRHLVGPALLTVFLVPVARHMMGIVAMPMQVVSAHGSATIASTLGVPVTASGVQLSTPSAEFLVAQECSGLSSLLALLLVTATAVVLLDMRWWAKLVLLVAIPPIVLVANTIRLVAVVVAAEFLGPRLALDALVHGTTDVIVYLAALTGVVLVADLLRSRPRPPDLQAGASA